MEIGFGITNGILLGVATGSLPEAEPGRSVYFHVYLAFIIIYLEW